MFIPKGAVPISQIQIPQLSVGLQAVSGDGKSHSAATFPFPTYCDFDHNLVALKHHPNAANITAVPFWNDDFCAEYAKPKFSPGHEFYRANRRDAFKKWLIENSAKFEVGQTLVIDSWTTLQDGFDQQQDLEPKPVKGGGYDEFDFWAKKIDYARDILVLLKSLKCHFVVTFHEMSARDTKGNLLEKIQPLMQGKFVTKIQLYFTDFYRPCVFEKLDKDGKPVLAADGIGKVVEYWWQIKSDSIRSLKTRMDTPKMFVPAGYQTLQKYFELGEI